MAQIQPIGTNNAAYIERLLNVQGKEVIKKLFFDFKTANIVRRYSGIDKTLDLATLVKNKSLVEGFSPVWSGTSDAFLYDKVTLTVGIKKIELDLTYNDEKIQAFEAYLEGAGIMTENQTSWGIQFIQWLIGEAAQGIAEEYELATWGAIKDTSTTAIPDADLNKTFDGLRHQAATICAANGSQSVISTGAIDRTNAVYQVENFFLGFDPRIQATGAIIACTYKTFNDYKLHYRDINKFTVLTEKLGKTDFEAIPIYLGGEKTMLVPFVGMGSDDALIGTRAEWIGMGYQDNQLWDVQKRDWQLHGLMSSKFGVTFTQRAPGYILANDRLISIEATRTV